MKKINKSHITIAIGIVVLLAIIIKSAWLVDDAYISFRYVRNILNGYGLRWNVIQRVQAYTNPLYVFLMVPLYAVSSNMYLSSLFLSISLTVSAVFIAIKPRDKKNLIPFIICIIILITSKAFIDYSTSGLETPLTFLITALFYREFFSNNKIYGNKSFLKLCFIASLITINRIDAILIFIPPLCYSFFKEFKPKKIVLGFLGFLPFILWEIFSFFYYGFFFPNTAYAKLNITTSSIDLITNGIKYILTSSIYGDNIILIVILSALLIGIFLRKRRNSKYMIAAISALLYIIYIIYIGGDFMVGRFTSIPFFLSVIIIFELLSSQELQHYFQIKATKQIAIALSVIILFLGCIPETSPITSPIGYQEYYDYLRHTNPIDRPRDVRSFYYRKVGLLTYIYRTRTEGYNPEMIMHEWGYMGADYNEDEVYVSGAMGFMGYFCPEETVLIDMYALCDPLLARIPAPPNQWMAHNQRGIPLGYVETIETGINVIEDPSLKEFYDKINIIVSGKIFDKERLITILKMNLGKYDYLIDEYTESNEYRDSVKKYGNQS